MNPIISKLISEGDYYLKEAKSMFYTKKEAQHCASCNSCTAIKKYLDAYEKYLFKDVKLTDNYHVLLHMITEKDPEFKKFSEKIYEVKCFAEESEKKKESFFLFAEEINEVLHIVFDIREYIAEKVDLQTEFLAEYLDPTMMTT